MSAPGPTLEILGRIAYQVSLLQPFALTHIHLIASALFPIYTGAHASLSRPKSAAVPSKNKTENEEPNDETERQMEGLSPSDAILYPVLTGCMLGGLYFLIKWMQDPTLLNKILNAYLSVFGLMSVTKLLGDSMENITSFIFPTRYTDRGVMWEVKRKQRRAYPRPTGAVSPSSQIHTSSPFPGVLSRLSFPEKVSGALWTLRDLLTRPPYIVEVEFGSTKPTVSLKPHGLVAIFGALYAVLYYNFIDNPWWLTNLLGFSFSYSALQIISPTTFWTGSLVLISLLIYDIYFVFFTPLMMTVATQLDIPAKLLFPRPPGVDDDPGKKAMSMLGLGDVVIPGMIIGFALRFDLYLFYLRKQTRQTHEMSNLQTAEKREEKSSRRDTSSKDDNKKPQYRSANGGWGERFWTSSNGSDYIDGGKFPKTYFHASIVGYVFGLLCTLGVLHVYKHGQPALLYLVPGVLGSLWGTAFVKGDIKTLWNYSEADEEDMREGKDIPTSKKDKEAINQPKKGSKDDTSKGALKDSSPSHTDAPNSSKAGSETNPAGKLKYGFFSIKFSGPPRESLALKPDHPEPIANLEDELQRASEQSLLDHESGSSTGFSLDGSPRHRSADGIEDEPAEKRQRRE